MTQIPDHPHPSRFEPPRETAPPHAPAMAPAGAPPVPPSVPPSAEAGSSAPPFRSGPSWGLVRAVWAVVMLGALVAVWFLGAPSSTRAELDWSALVALANSAQAENNSRAEGAPQQQVVNGWHTNELLGINIAQLGDLSARQASEAEMNERNGALLGVLGAGLLGDLAIRGFAEHRRTKRS